MAGSKRQQLVADCWQLTADRWYLVVQQLAVEWQSSQLSCSAQAIPSEDLTEAWEEHEPSFPKCLLEFFFGICL